MAVLHWLGQEFRVQCRAERKAPDAAGRCRPGGPRPRAPAGPGVARRRSSGEARASQPSRNADGKIRLTLCELEGAGNKS